MSNNTALGNFRLTRFGADVLKELSRRRHRIETVDGWSLGRLSAVSKERRILRAAANPRYMQGHAFGR